MDLQAKVSRREALKISAATTATLALAACGGSNPASPSVSGPHTLNIWVWAGAALQQSGLKALAAAYPNDFKNVKFNITTIPNGDQGLAQQLSLALAAHKNVPDFFMLNYTELPQFAEAGVLEEIGRVINPIKDDLYAGALNISVYHGSYFAFPYELKSKLFYYRPDLFAQAGINVDSITTPDDFIAAGQKFRAKFPNKYMMNLGTQPAGYLFHEMLSAFPNVSFADRSGNYSLTTNPAFTKAFSFLKQIHDSGIAQPIDDFSADWPAAIKNETIGGFLIANWMKEFLPQYATSAQASKWKAKTWPTLFPEADERYGSDAGGSVFVVSKASPNKDLAVETLTRYCLDKQGALAAFGATGRATLTKSTQPALLDALSNTKKSASMSDKDWQELPQNFFGKDYYSTEFGTYDLAKTFGYDPKAVKEFTILQQWADKMLQGKASVEAALSGAQHDMQTQIGNPYQR